MDKVTGQAESNGAAGAVSLRATIVADEEQISSDLSGEAVILDLRSGVYYGLDSVGARIWSLAQRPVCVAEIRDALLAEYEVESDHCERDLLALLEDLAAHGLVKVTGEADA